MSDVDDLLREMDREGDGWYGRATHALQDLRAKVEALEQERNDEFERWQDAHDLHCRAKEQLAAMRQERDALKAQVFTQYDKEEALEQEIGKIVLALGCHRGYILETIGDVTDRADSTPGADEYRRLQAHDAALRAKVEVLEMDVLGARSEIEAMRLRYEAEQESVQGCTAKVVALKSQLTAMKQERDEAERRGMERAAEVVLQTVIKFDVDWLRTATKAEAIAETLRQASAALRGETGGG
jgi:outer membrane murein-binding lipoprotein Lpp